MPIAAVTGAYSRIRARPVLLDTAGLVAPKVGRFVGSVRVTPSEREVAVDMVLLVAILAPVALT